MPPQLEPLDPLLGLDALEAPATTGDGQPKLLPIHAIDEDPDQPRSVFDAEALQQLADTIMQRGVRHPISVRPHPEQLGRWMLNFGARRLRASKLAGEFASKVIASPPVSLTLWARCDGADVMIDLRAVPEEAGFVSVQKSHGAD